MLHPLPSLAADPSPQPTSIAGLLETLRSPDVRALAALVASPHLVAANGVSVAMLSDAWRSNSLSGRAEWIATLDTDPAPLQQHLARSNARQLGRYAEALWQFWFAHLPGARVYAAGLPVKDGRVVRGEFDFIVGLPGLPGVQHLEMGYKFYLHCPPGAGWSRLFGPNPIDRLDRKWRHMIDAQLALSQTALGRAALPAGLAQVVPRACLQGWLFYPLDATHPVMIDGISPAHWRGWWCRNDARGDGGAARWAALAEAWTLLPRLAWIAPAAVEDDARLYSASTCGERLSAHFATSTQAQLIAGLARGRDGVWREIVRVFVVAAEWPGPSDQASDHLRSA